MTNAALKLSLVIPASSAEYTIEIWGKAHPREKERTKTEELQLLTSAHPDLHCGFLEQVHGNTVLQIPAAVNSEHLGEADAVFTREAGFICCVRTADCVPLLGYSEEIPVCFAIHAGWRGLRARVITATINDVVCRMGVKPSKLRIFIGPHIQRDSYETGSEVFRLFDARYYISNGNKGWLDLTALARDELLACGIPEQNISGLFENTFTSSSYFSHRAAETGRNLNVIFISRNPKISGIP